MVKGLHHDDVVDVTLPDGTRVRASSILDRLEDDEQRDFGLYLDERWQPTWPAEVIEWPDLGLPADPEGAAAHIRKAFARAQAGERVEVGCLGGLGRTGTVLACMAVLAGIRAPEAVTWVRSNYNSAAVETPEQKAWVLWFARISRCA
jgi:protein-tyrosine phosphatase